MRYKIDGIPFGNISSKTIPFLESYIFVYDLCSNQYEFTQQKTSRWVNHRDRFYISFFSTQARVMA